jgi:2-polyprenyl-3-methyl-5-hydroxy-6-metoxy-1,4-benzoquinol methylase
VLDPGCGNGKSAVWLAEHGFEVIAIDLSPSAIAQARRRAARHGVHEQTRFHVGRFPDDLQNAGVDLTPDSFDLITERAFLQHLGHGRQLRTTVDLLASVLKPGALLYSLMIAAEGASGHWGIVKWSQADVRSALEPRFEIREMRRDVFTPGEPGSVPAWLTVAQVR